MLIFNQEDMIMEPYKAKKLPYEINIPSDILNLLCEAKEAYGEYKGYLKNMSYDYKCFLENAFVNDIFYSFKIDNAKVNKEDMFYMTYMNKSNTSILYTNIKKSLLVGLTASNKNGFSLDVFNKINKTLLAGLKKDNSTKGSGHLRKTQTYLLKPGIAGSSVSFIPPVHTELNSLMKNLCDYINSKTDEAFISTILTHYQFEKIHPYMSNNGKMGRIIIPIQYSFYKNEPPILFISESIDNLRNTYFTMLSTEDNDVIHFVKFMLQCIVEQCNLNVKKIKRLNKLYKRDLEEFKTEIGGSTIYKVYPEILRRIVFTTADIVNDCNLHINSVNKVLNKLVEKGYSWNDPILCVSFFYNYAILHEYHPVCNIFCKSHFMGNHNHSRSFISQLFHDGKYLPGKLGVKSRCRFVKQDDLRIQCYRPRNSNPLLLSAGKL